MLLTDHRVNLGELFEVGREIVSYRDKDECAELAEYYLTHHEEREAIASAGQRRTLREHTYGRRMLDLVDILQGHV